MNLLHHNVFSLIQSDVAFSKLYSGAYIFFQKLQKRLAAVNKKSSWDETKKQKISRSLKIGYMSSECEISSGDEDVYVVKPLPWRTEEFNKIILELDAKAKSCQTKKGSRQEVKRVTSNQHSNRPVPEHIPDCDNWVVQDQ